MKRSAPDNNGTPPKSSISSSSLSGTQSRRRSPRSPCTQPRCTIWLPDDVLTVIASFISWDDAFASRYRTVCRAFQFGIDLTAMHIATQSTALLHARFKRRSKHFGPGDVQPLCVRRVAPGRLIQGSWRLLMRQVFGECSCCGSSTRWMYACSETPGCTQRICITCLEASAPPPLREGRVLECCSKWVCSAHTPRRSRMRKCAQCHATCCSDCLHPRQQHHYNKSARPASTTPTTPRLLGTSNKRISLYCAECNAWDSDTEFE